MNAELLTYSRSKVAFAGLTLEGAVVEQDSDLTTAIYGKDIPFRRVLMGNVKMGNVKPPAAAAPFMAALSMAGHQAAAHEAHEEMQDKK
jgi:SH3 domain-containing YSC84-like protein 1